MDTATAVDEAVRTRRAEFVTSLRRRDAATACLVYANDAHLFAPAAGSVHGRSDICRYWQAGLDSGMADIELEPVELRTRGLLAYEVGRYRLCVQPTDGPAVVESGHYVQLHEQQADGTWQRAFELYSSGGPE